MGSESPSETEGSSFHPGDLVISEVTGEFLIVMSTGLDLGKILDTYGAKVMRGYSFGCLYRAAPSYLMLDPAVLRDQTRCLPPEGAEDLPGYIMVSKRDA